MGQEGGGNPFLTNFPPQKPIFHWKLALLALLFLCMGDYSINCVGEHPGLQHTGNLVEGG